MNRAAPGLEQPTATSDSTPVAGSAPPQRGDGVAQRPPAESGDGHDAPADGEQKPPLRGLLRRGVSRRQFLTVSAVAGVGLAGAAGVIGGLAPRRTGHSTALRPDGGEATTPGSFGTGTADPAASAGQGGLGSAGPPAAHTPVSAGGRGPVSFPSLAAARAGLRTPANANYVLWNPSWPADRDLEDVFASLSDNDILVLPERAAPYRIDSSEGFRASGVASVTGRNGTVPIVSRYRNGRSARGWFSMARARRGILGLGPGAVIEVSASSWRGEPQIQDKGSVQEDGWVSPGRFWTDTSGVLRNELVGCQERVLESAVADAYFGNFTMRGRDLGGVAYSGITASKGAPIFERLNLTGAWRGFLGVPNGEAGAIGSGGSGYYTISKCILGTRDSSGKRVGTSPIMINSSTGGGLIEDVDASETRAGMLTIWNSSGKHTLKNVNTRFNYGPGLNLEKAQPGFELEWIGGSIWADYKGRGGKPGKPADQGDRGGMHIGLFAEGRSAVITLRGVDFDSGATPGSLNIQSYGATKQRLADIRCFDASGRALPVKVYGAIS